MCGSAERRKQLGTLRDACPGVCSAIARRAGLAESSRLRLALPNEARNDCSEDRPLALSDRAVRSSTACALTGQMPFAAHRAALDHQPALLAVGGWWADRGFEGSRVPGSDHRHRLAAGRRGPLSRHGTGARFRRGRTGSAWRISHWSISVSGPITRTAAPPGGRCASRGLGRWSSRRSRVAAPGCQALIAQHEQLGARSKGLRAGSASASPRTEQAQQARIRGRAPRGGLTLARQGEGLRRLVDAHRHIAAPCAVMMRSGTSSW